ncbi:MAG: cysteine desulfurase-like protein [Chloroflexota bacterium]
MTTFDVDALRSRFPALAIEQDGRPVALFDGPGGTQVTDTVIEAVARYYRTSNANHGGDFLTSQRSDAVIEDAHAALADLLNAADPAEIKLGANMTSLTMHVARSITASLAPGDEIVVTTLDHEANVGPWRSAAADRGIGVRTVDIRPDDVTLDIEAFDRILHDRPKLVAFGWASNAVGSINPVAELVHRAHEAGALTYVDAVHAAPHLPIDVQAIGTDLLACSVYKFFGPHVGVLYGRGELLDSLPTYKLRPAYDRFETGTGNFEGWAGALAAVEYIAEVGRTYGGAFADRFPGMTGRRLDAHAGMAAIRAYEMPLFGRLLDGLDAIPGARIWGITDRARMDERTPTAAVTFAGVTAEHVSVELGRRGIATWWGNFYAVGVIERLGLEPHGVLRIGLTHYNTAAEVDRLLAEIRSIVAGG